MVKYVRSLFLCSKNIWHWSLFICSLNPFSVSSISGKLIGRDITNMCLQHLGHNPLGKPLLIPSRRNYTLSETMMTSPWDGQLFIKRETRQWWSTPISSIPCTQTWVLGTTTRTWFWSTTISYIVSSNHIWISYTSPHYESLTNMLSKLSRTLRKGIRRSLSLQMCHNRSMVKLSLTHKTKDRENISNLNTTSPICK
jgi:hypothetical protein